MCFDNGNNSCIWIICICLLLFCCCGNNFGCSNGCGCGCNNGCNNDGCGC